MPTEIVVPDSLASGITTDEMLEAEPYCFRVTWIEWNSSFRGSGLRVGDRIVGLDGAVYDPAKRKDFVHKAIGSYSETQHWRDIGAEEGHKTTLTVKRGSELLQIEGTIHGERRWMNDDGRRTLGPGGPDYMSSSGFNDGSWSGWYEKRVKFMSNVLDGLWMRRFNNRNLLKEHLDEWPRTEYFLNNHPGPFADVLKADWDGVRESLQGTRYDITGADLAYRELGEQRASQISTVGKSARETFLRDHAAELIATSPIPDPMSMEAREKAAGKLVALPALRNQDWFNEGGKSWLAWGGRDACYFLDPASPGMRKMFDAVFRYGKLVSATLPETYSVIGRIGPNPKMLVRRDEPWTGLLLEPAAATAGQDAFFVDLTADEAQPRFAGEKELADPGQADVSDDATPDAVLTALFTALKLGAEERWKALFATWETVRWGDGKIYYTAYKPPSESVLSREWLRARRLILGKIYDVRVAQAGEIETLLDGTEFEGAPKVERIVLVTDHVGLFDGEYRAFSDVDTHRLWPLQRRDGGPWRVAADWGI